MHFSSLVAAILMSWDPYQYLNTLIHHNYSTSIKNYKLTYVASFAKLNLELCNVLFLYIGVAY